MEEHRPRKLLAQVCACPEPGEGMPSAAEVLVYFNGIHHSVRCHGRLLRHQVPDSSTRGVRSSHSSLFHEKIRTHLPRHEYR